MNHAIMPQMKTVIRMPANDPAAKLIGMDADFAAFPFPILPSPFIQSYVCHIKKEPEQFITLLR